MPKYKEENYASAVARVRAIENKRLDRIALEKMISAKTIEDTMHVLIELGWPKSKDFESLLEEEMSQTLALLEGLGGEPILKLFRIKFDFHNLKVLIKSELLGTNADELLISFGNYDIEQLKKCLLDRDYKHVSMEMAEAIEAVFDHYARLKDPQMIDILLDKAMFMMLLGYAKEQPDQRVNELIKTQIDLYNIKTFLRIRQIGKSYLYLEMAIADGGYVEKKVYLANAGIAPDKVESLFTYTPYSGIFEHKDSLEAALEGYFKEKRQMIKMTAFGLAPLYDFLMNKETEISNARMIFTCKQNGIAPELIHARLLN